MMVNSASSPWPPHFCLKAPLSGDANWPSSRFSRQLMEIADAWPAVAGDIDGDAVHTPGISFTACCAGAAIANRSNI